MSSKENKQFWDDCNISYSKVWEARGRQEMSKRELGYIDQCLRKFKPLKILDVGVGNGRILENLIKFSPPKAEIFGIDISKEMVKICQKKFRDNKKIKKISICDLSTEELPFKDNFDFVTMVRVLKYNKNWPKMIEKIYDKLMPGGIFIFTMPNKISISFFSSDTFSEKNIPILYSSEAELKKILINTGLKLIEFQAFSKMPNFLYHISQNKFYIKSLLFAEKTLETIFGNSFLGRELFICCSK